MQRIEPIDYLRAVAVGLTLVGHARALITWPTEFGYWLYANATFWAGVDLFFAISGFVIARDLIVRFECAAPAEYWAICKAFWLRRAFRILPAAWLWLALGIIGSITVNRYGSFGAPANTATDAVCAFFQVANLRLWFVQMYGGAGFNPVYWSLSVEEQFYVALPLCLVAFGRRFPWVLCLAWIAFVFIPPVTRPHVGDPL
jgi:peptidoglycan/LPS O-acetylase OafA/YrhL